MAALQAAIAATTVKPTVSVSPVSPVAPAILGTVVSPVAPVAPKAKRTTKPKVAPVAPDSDTARAAFVARIESACAAYKVGCEGMGDASKRLSEYRATLKTAVEEAVKSGLFTKANLIEVATAAFVASGMSDTSVSKALIAAGLRQRAERSDKGTGKGGKTPEVPVVLTADALAKGLVASLGLDAAKQLLCEAYQLMAAMK